MIYYAVDRWPRGLRGNLNLRSGFWDIRRFWKKNTVFFRRAPGRRSDRFRVRQSTGIPYWHHYLQEKLIQSTQWSSLEVDMTPTLQKISVLYHRKWSLRRVKLWWKTQFFEALSSYRPPETITGSIVLIFLPNTDANMIFQSIAAL